MKIAVCLSGHLRKFEQTFPALHLYLLKNHECDVFISTWDKMGYHSSYKRDSTDDMTSKYTARVEELYKPKKMIVEGSQFIEELKQQGNIYAPHLRNEPKHVGHMASMFYKIYAANELRKRYELETGSQYDWVVRCRPDLMFHGTTSFPNNKPPRAIFMPSHLCREGWLCDQFAIATSNDMDLYASFFFSLEEYFRSGNEFYPEKFVDWCMKKKNLTMVKWDSHFSILR
jgi:hypothetical protein